MIEWQRSFWMPDAHEGLVRACAGRSEAVTMFLLKTISEIRDSLEAFQCVQSYDYDHRWASLELRENSSRRNSCCRMPPPDCALRLRPASRFRRRTCHYGFEANAREQWHRRLALHREPIVAPLASKRTELGTVACPMIISIYGEGREVPDALSTRSRVAGREAVVEPQPFRNAPAAAALPSDPPRPRMPASRRASAASRPS